MEWVSVMSAASILAEYSVKTLLVDENEHSGGQLWRGLTEQSDSAFRFINSSNNKVNLLATAGYRDGSLHIHAAASVPGIFPENYILLSSKEEGIKEIKAGNIIFATGAREKVRPFEGWTDHLSQVYRGQPGLWAGSSENSGRDSLHSVI